MRNNIKLLHQYSFWENFILFYPIKVLFFAEVSGSFTAAMSLFAIQNISSSLFELPTGFLSDKWGRKWVCRAGAFVMLAAFVIYAFANCYEVLFIGAVINGLSWALATGNNSSLLYDSLAELGEKDNYHKEISKNTAILQFSLGLAALIGAGFIFISLRTVMIASIIPAVIAFLITLGLVEPKKQQKAEANILRHTWWSIKYILKHKRLKYITLAETLHYGFNEAAFDFNSVFFKQFIPEWALGIFRSLGHFANSIANYLSFFTAKKIGLRMTIIIGTYLDNIINIISVLLANVLSPFLKVITAFCNGIRDPALDSLIQNDCNEQQRATILSVISLFGSLFYSTCAVFIGILADMTTPYMAMLISYTLALLSNVLFIVALKNKGC